MTLLRSQEMNFLRPLSLQAWTYTLDGSLIGSKHHKHMKDFNPEVKH